MFFIKFYRYIMGYIKLKVHGRFTERFLNLITQNKIPFWNIKKYDECIHGYTLAKNYKSLIPIVRKTKVNIEVIEKKGFFFKFKRYKKRWGFLIGGIVILVLFFMSSRVILTIHVSGNQKVSSEEILKVLEDEGFKVGTVSKKLNIDILEQKALLKLTDLSFLAVNIKGFKSVVEVKERTIPPLIEDNTGNGNLIASENAVISKTDVHGGLTNVKKGDIVSKGDILVSGFGEKQSGEIVLQKAKGKVYGLVEYIQDYEKYNYQYIFNNTSEKENIIYEVFGFKIPFIKEKNITEDDLTDIRKENVYIFGIKLPIIKHIQKVTKRIKNEVERTNEELREQLESEIMDIEKQLPQDQKLIDKQIEEYTIDNGVKYSVKFYIEKNIAQFQTIY